MFKYIVKRLLLAIIILLGVSFIVYALVRMMPMNYVETKYAAQLAQGTIKQEDIDRFLDLYGLNSSIVGGYFTWLKGLLSGNLGNSFKYNRPVTDVITDYMWISFSIALVATILQFLIAIPLGITSATHQYSVRDYTVTVLTMIGLSFPTYFFAAIVIKIFSVDLGWLPNSGLVDTSVSYAANFAGQMHKFGDMAVHLIMPILVSVVLSIGGLMRYTRTNTLEVLNADYIRTARAKGLSEHTVIYKHAFRNTLIPLATLLAGILPGLFGGMMITEEVFAIDGIGRLAYLALKDGDIPFVMGYNMFLAILTVIGTLLSDIMYAIVDPRVKLTK
ncbi:MAG: ABC transporter permease [Clostridiales bacterium]|nr:ABC transporter permease [Clostridiales bacterium]